MAAAPNHQVISCYPSGEKPEAPRRFRLANYMASLGPPIELSGRELPKEVDEACPRGYESRVRALILHPVNELDRNFADQTAVVLDVLRAGFLVLACRQVTVDSRAECGTAYFLYVWRA